MQPKEVIARVRVALDFDVNGEILLVFPYDIKNDRGHVSIFSTVRGWLVEPYSAVMLESRPAATSERFAAVAKCEEFSEEELAFIPSADMEKYIREVKKKL